MSRFVGDESGQGIIFAAATLLVLVGFVAFVFNIGRLLDRRTKMQIAADAAAYSGAMVEANSVSAIAYINSAMSQVYYNSLKYAVDVNVAAVAAELDRRLNPDTYQGDQAYFTYQAAYKQASIALPLAKQWMVQLSQLENAIAILTPQLMEEEMFAVAGRAGGERMSVYPSFRMYPSGNNPPISYSITCLGNGWKIQQIPNGPTITVQQLNGNTWDMVLNDGTSSREVQIKQDSPTEWQVQFSQPPGSPIQTVYLQNNGNLGWVVWSSSTSGASTPAITFTPVTVGGEQAVQVSEGGSSQVLERGADGNIYAWNSATNSYQLMTSNQTTVGGANVQVNVTNTIKFAGGGTAQIGNPTTVNIGGAHLVLGNPPNISTGMGPVWLSISGFNPNQFNVSVGGFSLTPGNSNGRWNEHYNPWDELWSRNRLRVMGTDANGNPNQWQYDHELLGALLQYEPDTTRFVEHAFMGSGNGCTSDSSTWPAWTAWFNADPSVAGPADMTWDPQAQPNTPRPSDAYCQTQNGVSVSIRTLFDDPNSVIFQMAQTDPNAAANNYYLSAPIFNSTSYGISAPLPPQMYPLVATEEFFKWGVNIGVWKHAYNGVIVPGDTLMLFPSTIEPAWGTVAIASARVGLSTVNGGLPSGGVVLPNGNGSYLCQFSDTDERLTWCQSSLQNLYYADVSANLFASKNQVSDFDLDENIIQSNQPISIDQSGLSYLWSAILASNPTATEQEYNYLNNTWRNSYLGEPDTRVGGALRNMRNRQGASFDYGSSQMNQVVEH